MEVDDVNMSFAAQAAIGVAAAIVVSSIAILLAALGVPTNLLLWGTVFIVFYLAIFIALRRGLYTVIVSFMLAATVLLWVTKMVWH